MEKELLHCIWQNVFDAVPTEQRLQLFADFINDSDNPPDAERILFWLALKSSALSFADENDRVTWIADKISAHVGGEPLPGFSEMPTR